MKLRYARADDLIRLTDIDNYYITNSQATFYVEPRKPEDRKEWFSNYKEQGPYRMIVCEDRWSRSSLRIFKSIPRSLCF
jgi:L-amino acid N-acyltransferase YncA